MAASRSRLIDGLTFIAVLCFVLAGVALVQQVQSLAEASGWVAHTREVLQTMDRAMLGIREAEATQRGLLLTGETMFNQAYRHAETETRQEMAVLRKLTADNPRQQANLAEMAPEVERRLDLLRANFDLHNEGRPPNVQTVDAGLASMQRLSGHMQQVRAEEERLLAERLRTTEDAKRGLQLTAIGTAVLGLLLLLGLRTVATRDRNRLIAARARGEATQQRLQAIVDGAPAMIYLKDSDGRYQLVNRAAVVRLGRTPEEVLGKTDEELFGAAVAKGLATNDAIVWRERRDCVFAEDIPFEGRQRHFRADKFLLPSRDGQPDGLLCGISTDITDLLDAQGAVRHANEVLEERVQSRTNDLADANAELQAFAHTVAHDLRAPLRNIQGFAEALREDEAEHLSAEGQLYASRISLGVARMDQLITDLLEYSRLGRARVQAQPVQLASAVEQVLAQLAGEIASAHASVRVDQDLPAVLAHPSTLVQVLANLVGNAVKFVAPGRQPEVHVHAQVQGGRVRLLVDDNGIGIAPQHRERVFQVFERLHGQEKFPGTGIGLAIVRRGIERMGGTVAIENSPAGGTRFVLDLPVC